MNLIRSLALATALLGCLAACSSGDGGEGSESGQPLKCLAEPPPSSSSKGETFSRTGGQCGADLRGTVEPGGACGTQSDCKPVCCACPDSAESYAAVVCSDGVCLQPCDACNSADLLSVCGSAPSYKVCFGCPDTMSPPELVAGGLDAPDEIALTDDAVLVATGAGLLRLAKADGSAALLFSGSVDQIATDGAHAYFEKDGLQRVPVLGGAAQPFETPTYLRDIAVGGGYVYFASAVGSTKTIQRAPAGGGAPEVVAALDDTPTAIEVSNGYLYFTTEGPNKAVFRAPAAGGQAETVVADEGDIDSFAVGPDALYYVAAGRVMRAPFGGTPEVLDATLQSPDQLAIDGEWLYVVASELHVVKLTKPYTAHITTQYGARDVAVDASHVYWSQGDSVWRAKKLGAPTRGGRPHGPSKTVTPLCQPCGPGPLPGSR